MRGVELQQALEAAAPGGAGAAGVVGGGGGGGGGGDRGRGGRGRRGGAGEVVDAPEEELVFFGRAGEDEVVVEAGAAGGQWLVGLRGRGLRLRNRVGFGVLGSFVVREEERGVLGGFGDLKDL